MANTAKNKFITATVARYSNLEIFKKLETSNAFIIPDELKFKEFIRDNMRLQPDIYAEIRRVNDGWLKPTTAEANTMDLGKNECSASNYGKV